jgi:heme/copper-type cytochrome/quinol oxidase subunit 4
MAEVMAGLICGFALSIVATPVAAFYILRARATSPLMHQLVPEGTSLLAVSVLLNSFFILTMTAIGILLGMLLFGLASSNPESGLGSPNQVYTAFILIITAVAVLPLSIASAKLRVPLLIGGLVFIATFGWFMPYLASLSPIEG